MIALTRAVEETQSKLSQRLHPKLRVWFHAHRRTFTHAQLLCVPAVLDRASILLTSPTGSGKTLAGFLGVFDALIRELESGRSTPGVRCIYVSSLRALAYDIERDPSKPNPTMGTRLPARSKRAGC
ncbi:MAG: DEAD/DEAH box helicase [Chthoniobacterales bacterium]|nr:DEAD/DEAH box helicase [Chthoniobacterales bacterium]